MLLPRRLERRLEMRPLDIRLGTRTRTVRAYRVFTRLQTPELSLYPHNIFLQYILLTLA
jgi:hypothetical protein